MTHRHPTGKHFLVRCSENEVFLGRALDEGEGERIALEGRSFHPLSAAPGGGFVATPFPTRVEFRLHSGPTLHAVEGQEAVEEAERALSEPCARVDALRFPLLARWFDTPRLGAEERARATLSPMPLGHGGVPWVDSFESGAEAFRRTLLRAPRADSTRELDRLTELEGDLVIELGKVANDVASELTTVAERDAELGRFLEQLHDSLPAAASGAPGASYLAVRLHGAKVWARERGRTALVRELCALQKDLFTRQCEVALEHDHALDVLVSETLASQDSSSEPRHDLEPAAPLRSAREPARPAAPTVRR